MADLVLNIDLAHSPVGVWRALTDQRQLSAWFLSTEADIVAGRRARVHPPAGLAGLADDFDVEITEVEKFQSIRQHWTAKEWQAEISWELTETHDGCQLRMTQTGFHGIRGERRRRDLRRTYQVMFGLRLPELLDRLASGTLDLSGATVDRYAAAARPRPSVDTTATPPHSGRSRPSSGPRVRMIYLGVALLVALAASVAVGFWGALDGPPLPTDRAYPIISDSRPALTAPTLRASSAATAMPKRVNPSAAAKVTPTVTGAGSPLSASTSAAPPTPLDATYRITSSPFGFGGFDIEVTLHNSGDTAHRGWKVVLTMPSDGVVKNQAPEVVVMAQDGSVVVLTPAQAAETVPAGGSVTFTIRSPGTLAVGGDLKSCTIDGVACGRR